MTPLDDGASSSPEVSSFWNECRTGCHVRQLPDLSTNVCTLAKLSDLRGKLPTVEIRDPHGRVATCGCCQLMQPVCLDSTGVTSKVCAQCLNHQGMELPKRLTRAESHERMLRERLTACRDTESRASAEAKEARKAVESALQSRGRLAALIVEAADRDRNHRCVAQALAQDPRVVRWARRENEEDTWDDDHDGWRPPPARRRTQPRIASTLRPIPPLKGR